MQEHCVPEVLSYCVYYGATRTLGPEDLQSFDVVLTTYQTVTGEHGSGIEESSRKRKKIQRSLYEVDWKVYQKCFR
jgi:SWI/SNF-related matrix-associated actin-dependent regulator of chromatin subfamily A3